MQYLGDQMNLDKFTLRYHELPSPLWLGDHSLKGKESTSSVSNIKQKPEEPYEDLSHSLQRLSTE